MHAASTRRWRPRITDNDPASTGRAFIAWTQSGGIRHVLIEPGRPMHNGGIERCDGRFRDEGLNGHGNRYGDGSQVTANELKWLAAHG
ncbi:MAG: integrase core domain-containing protein [Burkholderiales bacterium]|nr:integrase core domain-containing protein [Burkholderiales bacterium]MDE1925991.1 integrase core domain-containing protein [Burkholderiales bacterium]MDE2157945.1 integrase core domain-containing protein [Burkholderiales bacterium]